MWLWGRLQSIKWTDKIKSDEVLERVKEGKRMLYISCVIYKPQNAHQCNEKLYIGQL